MTEDRRFERLARDWLEQGPINAPAHVVQAAFLEINTTSQERDRWVPWRLLNMTPALRIAAAILVFAVLGGGAFLVFRNASDGGVVGASPAPVPSAPPSTPTPRPSLTVPDGTYFGAVQPVSDILSQLADDPTLTATERTAIIDSVLEVRGATTFQTRIDVVGNAWRVSQGVDGVFMPESWTFVPTGERQLLANGSISFEVGGCDPAGSRCEFTLHADTPAPSKVEAFVRRIVFESAGPFVPQP